MTLRPFLFKTENIICVLEERIPFFDHFLVFFFRNIHGTAKESAALHDLGLHPGKDLKRFVKGLRGLFEAGNGLRGIHMKDPVIVLLQVASCAYLHCPCLLEGFKDLFPVLS